MSWRVGRSNARESDASERQSPDTRLALNLTPAEWHAGLAGQMEEFFVQVWCCESAARAEDRLALTLRRLPDARRERVR